MAGGMRRGARGDPMYRRVEAGTGTTAQGARHCWVLDPADRKGVKRAGLLLEWRHSGDGAWEARVVYVAELRADGIASVEEWIPAVLLEPT